MRTETNGPCHVIAKAMPRAGPSLLQDSLTIRPLHPKADNCMKKQQNKVPTKRKTNLYTGQWSLFSILFLTQRASMTSCVSKGGWSFIRLIFPLCGVQGGSSSRWQRLHKCAATAFMNAQQVASARASGLGSHAVAGL